MGALKFTPQNEVQTREWFAAQIEDFDYDIIESRTAFPDYLLQDTDGVCYRVEVESESANFIMHGHDSQQCDFVLCWRHNTKLDLPVLELSSKQWFNAGEVSSNHLDESLLSLYENKEQSQEHKILKIRELCQRVLVDEYDVFINAYAENLRAQSRYIKAIEPSQRALNKATRALCRAISDEGLAIDVLAPKDLFILLSP